MNSNTVGIIGLGPVGAMAAQLCIAAGFSTIAFDRRDSVTNLSEHQHAGYQLTNTGTDLDGVNTLVICVRLVEDDEEPLDACASLINSFCNRPSLIVLQSTIIPGCTRKFAFNKLRSASGVVVSPERLQVGDRPEDVVGTPRLVAGFYDEDIESCVGFLRRLKVDAIRVSSPEVAELSKLVENAYLTTNICFASEVAKQAAELGVCGTDVLAAAATQHTTLGRFSPGAGIGGHCLPQDFRLLLKSSQRKFTRNPLLDGVLETMNSINENVVRALVAMLAPRSLQSLVIVGVGFKPGAAETFNSPAFEIVRILRELQVKIRYVDSQVSEFVVDGIAVSRIASSALLSQVSHFDAALLLAGDQQLDVGELTSLQPKTLDVGGSRVMKGDTSQLRLL